MLVILNFLEVDQKIFWKLIIKNLEKNVIEDHHVHKPFLFFPKNLLSTIFFLPWMRELTKISGFTFWEIYGNILIKKSHNRHFDCFQKMITKNFQKHHFFMRENDSPTISCFTSREIFMIY
jgi:hypothetical protein